MVVTGERASRESLGAAVQTHAVLPAGRAHRGGRVLACARSLRP